MRAVTRKEKIWKAMMNDDPSAMANPVTREEKKLAKLAKVACEKDLFCDGPDAAGMMRGIIEGTAAEVICADAENVRDSLFANDTHLTKVSFPTVTSIGYRSFYHCEALESVDIPKCNSIDNSAFMGCTALKFVDFPKAANANLSFYGCTALKSVNLPEATGEITNFQGCKALESVNIPKATSIYYKAFGDCTALESADFPEVTSMGTDTFRGCTALKSVNLPAVTSIDNHAFYDCAALESVKFPAVTSVGMYVFASCDELKSVDFPVVTSINQYAFNVCGELAIVVLRSTEGVCTLSNINAFNGTPFASGGTGGKLLVPSALLESYKTASNWSTLYGYGTNEFLVLEDYTVDGTVTGELDENKI